VESQRDFKLSSWRRRPLQSLLPYSGSGLWRYYLGYALGRMSGLVVLPVVSRMLGESGFGRYEACLALLVAASIVFDAGMGAAIVRFLDATPASRHTIGAAGALQFGTSLIATVVLLPFLIWLAPAGVSIVALLGLVGVFSFVEGYAVLGSGVLRAQANDGLFLGLSLSRVAVTVTVTILGAHFWGPLGALLGIATGGIGFAVYTLVKLMNGRTLGTGEIRRNLARWGVPLVATTLMTWALSLSDRLFLIASVSPSTLGDYSANYRLGYVVLLFFAAPLILAWLPIARSAQTTRDQLLLSHRWSLRFAFASLGSLIVLVGFSSSTIPIVFGADFQADHFVIGVVGLSGWLGGMYYFVATPILVRDKTSMLANIAVSVVIVNLILNFALISSGGGAHGAALATLFSYLWLCVATFIAVRSHSAHQWIWMRQHSIPVLTLILGVVVAWVVGFWAGAIIAAAAAAISRAYRSRPEHTPSEVPVPVSRQ
jgi:O-antigen/teichoic acid export membrane protein